MPHARTIDVVPRAVTSASTFGTIDVVPRAITSASTFGTNAHGNGTNGGYVILVIIRERGFTVVSVRVVLLHL